MPHEIERVLAAAAGSFWAIEPQKAAEIVSLLALRAENGKGIDYPEKDTVAQVETVEHAKQGPIYVLNLEGTIFPKAGMLSRMSGGVSVEGFMRNFDKAASDKNARAIVIKSDSPGGVVDLVPEASAKILKARNPSRPIVAHVSPLCASAAYFMACGADEIVSTPTGRTGSIGVYQVRDDISKALEMRGIKRDVIKSGPRKAEGADGSLDELARAHLQAEGGHLYEMFVKHVAKARGVPVANVRADPENADNHFGGGRAYYAKKAQAQGLIDRIATFEETIERLKRSTTSSRVARARLSL